MKNGPLSQALLQNAHSPEALAALMTLICVVGLASAVAAYFFVQTELWKQRAGIPGLKVLSVLMAVVGFVSTTVGSFAIFG